MNRTRKLLAALAVSLAAPVFLVACGDEGGDEDPAEVLREAFTQETNYDSGVINIGLDGSLEGTTSGTLEADISGPFSSVEGEQIELQLDANANVSAEGIPDLPGGSVSFDFAGGFGIADDSLFVTYQDTTYEASEELFAEISPLLEVAESAGETTQDPESADSFIESLDDLENEGTEDVEGESTTHISGDLDFASLAEQGAAQSGVPFDTSQLEGFTSSVDVYVAEEDNSFRRIDLTFSADDVAALAAAGVEGLDFTISVGISDPNSEQTIEAPSDAQPLDDLLRQLGTSESDILNALEGGLVPPGLGGLGTGGLGGNGGGLGSPGGSAGDPKVQECVAEAQTSEEIVACLDA